MPQRTQVLASGKVNGLPAIITHHIFGEDAATLLPEGILEGQEDLLAFLLGNQGTDPFWARALALPQVNTVCHKYASAVHNECMVQFFEALHSSVSHLREEDMSVGRAFALGMAAHYVLDSVAHPLVYAQQEGIVAVDPSLAVARPEVHAIIEADIDVWMLMEKRSKTILDSPCASGLATTERINRVAGSMLSQAAWEVFGLEVGAAEFGLAVRDYQLFYRLIDPPALRFPAIVERLERLGRPYSWLEAHAHRVFEGGECPLANLEHRLWRNPATNEASTSSFADLFHDALMAWPIFAQRFVEGDWERLGAMVDNVTYNGRPA